MKASSVSLARLSLASALFQSVCPGSGSATWRRLENGSDREWTLSLPPGPEAPVGRLELLDATSGRTVGDLTRGGDLVRLAPGAIYILHYSGPDGWLRQRLRLADDAGTHLAFTACLDTTGHFAMRDVSASRVRPWVGPYVHVQDGDILINSVQLRPVRARDLP